MKRIGVLPSTISFVLESTINEDIKQLYLIYDNLTFGDNIDFIEMLRRKLSITGTNHRSLIKTKINDYINLIQREILVDIPLANLDLSDESKIKNIDLSLMNFDGIDGDLGSRMSLLLEDQDSRMKSLYINNAYNNIRAYPITSLQSFLNRPEAIITTPEEVLSVTNIEFPAITNTTSWEQIIEFKNDEDSYLKYLRLVNWANTVAKKNYSVGELTDYIQYIKAEYLDALKLHKLKYELKTFQVFLNFTAELIEKLIKIKLLDIVKMPLEFKKQKIEMLEEEKKLPGIEIAYFTKAQIELKN